MTVDSHRAGSTVETLVVPDSAIRAEAPTRQTSESKPEIPGRIVAVEVFVAILVVLIVSLASFQLRFTLPATGFVLFLVIVVAAIRLGFVQATITSVVAVGCLDFYYRGD